MSETKLTGFELLQKVGQGGMGIVWKARQLSLDRFVAIKLLAAGLSKNPDDVKRMMTEARTAARLKHPGIVQVYDASEEEGTFFFVMEYVDGYNVGQWLHRKQTIGWKDALLVAEHVATALDYAWRSAGMIHCDIKPENILVDKDGTIKVSDLGLSVTHETRSDVPSDILGTPSYMSPEQVRGDSDLDCRTDIYSLGATLYQMITGRRLFKEVGDRNAMDCQLTDQVPDPRELVPGLPAPVAALLERLLVKNREGRPRDWSAVLADLRRVERGHMPAGKPLPAGASTVKRAQISLRRERVGQEPEGESPKKRAWGVWVLAGAALMGVLVGAAVILPSHLAGWRTAQQHGVISPIAPRKTPVAEEMLGHDQAIASFAAAERWVEANPDRVDEGMRQFRRVIAQFPGTPAATRALDRVGQLQQQRERGIAGTWAQLKGQAETMAGTQRYGDAAHLLEAYAGRWATQTASNRIALARRLRQQADEQERVSADDEAVWQVWVKGLGAPLMLGKFAAAQQTVAQAQGEGRFKTHTEDIATLAQLLKAIAGIDERVLQSFARQIGTVVRVGLGHGEIALLIVSVNGKKVRGRTVEGQAEMSFGSDDLSLRERMARLGPVDAPDIAIVKGAAAVGAGAYDYAVQCFEKAGPLLSGPLLDELVRLRGGPTDGEAREGLARVLKAAGITVGDYVEAEWVASVNGCPLDRQRAAVVSAEMEKFLVTAGKTPFAVKATPVILALQQVCSQAEQGIQLDRKREPPAVRESP